MHDSLQPKNFLQPNSYKDSRFIAILSLLHGKISSLQQLLRVQNACPSFPTLFPGTSQIPSHLPSGSQPVPAVPGYQLPLCSFNRPRMPCENVTVCLSIGGICLKIFQLAVLGGHTRPTPPLVPDPCPCCPPPPLPVLTPGSSAGLGQHPLSPGMKPTFQRAKLPTANSLKSKHLLSHHLGVFPPFLPLRQMNTFIIIYV